MRAAGVVLACALAAGADDRVVTARLAWESGVLGKGATIDVALDAEGAGAVDLGDGLAVKVEAKATHVRVDTDLDGDLADERPDATKGLKVSRNYSLALRFAGAADPVPIVLRFCRTSVPGKTTLHYHVRSYRQGTVVLASRLRKVALADGDGDLRFDGKEDALYVDLDGDGALDDADLVRPGVPFRLGTRGFTARIVDPRGGAVEFETAPPPPQAPPKWVPSTGTSAGRTANPPQETLAELEKEYAKEKAWSARNTLVRLVGRHGTDDAFALLAKIVRDDGEKYVRRTAAEAMGYVEYRRAHLARVRGLAKSRDPYVQSGALMALHHVDDPERETVYVRELFATSSVVVAGAAARGLGYLDTASADAALLKAARKLKTDDLRAQAYAYLSYRADPPPIDLVLGAVGSENQAMRADALEHLRRFGHPQARARALAAAKADTLGFAEGRAVITILGVEGDRAAVTALLGMAAKLTADSVKKQLADALAPLRGPDAVAVFVAGLKHPAPAVRALAARLLADLPDRKATDALAGRARREKDGHARAAMLEALGDHADPRSVPFLLKEARARDGARRVPAIRALARIGMGDARVRGFFLKMLDSSRWENRIYAIDAAAATGGAPMVKRVASNLDHREWRVRLAAAEALGRVRIKACIEPLIARLDPEEHKRVRDAVAEALFRLTGQHFYDFADTWERWWKAHGETFEVPEAIPQRQVHKGGTVASFYGLPVGSGRVVFVIDESGSMGSRAGDGRNQLDVAVEQTLSAAGRLRPNDRVNVVFFESRVHVWQEDLVRLTAGNRRALERFVLARRPTGGTNLYDALEAALLMEDVDTVFLLSDGSPGSGKYVATPDILRAVTRINQTRRIAIHCVAIGIDSDLLKRLAAANGGRYVRR